MLCPNCESAAPGGSVCPHCGDPVPELETFDGQGGHYLRVLIFLSLALFVGASTIASLRSGRPIGWDSLAGSRWFWLYMLIFFLPAGLGVHFWYILRGEQIRITDGYIERRSRWGDERVYWADVSAYRKQVIPFRKTRLGRVARLSHWLTGRRLISRIPPYAYDLVSISDQGERLLFRLEPGAASDLPWLLRLMSQHLGEPETE